MQKTTKTEGIIERILGSYGFIKTNNDENVFFHFSILDDETKEALKNKQKVSIDFTDGDRGYIATKLQIIDSKDIMQDELSTKEDEDEDEDEEQRHSEEDKAQSRHTVENIAKNWKLEAKLEDNKYFYNFEEAQAILNAEKLFIIGRKGSGKSAICEYITNKQEHDLFSKKLSFKNFPFNELYSLENKASYTEPNQYITLWKYLIYSTVCQLMVTNENIDSNIRNELEKIYPSDSKKSLSRTINIWTSAEFGANVLGNGGTLKLERDVKTNHTTWIERVNILEDIILNYNDDSKYFIVFDELDEDFREIKEENSHIAYTNLLTSLFKAAQDVISVFNNEKNIYPVVFLRDDIYSLIKDSDKNKWRDYKLEIEWNKDKLKKLLAYRISKDIPNNDEILPFEIAWNTIFSEQLIKTGNKQSKKINSYGFISNSTQLRPRDYVRFLQVCAEETSKRPNKFLISASTTKYADREFSNYLRDEIVDEIYPILPEIDMILQIITNIRKPIFSVDEFRIMYLEYLESGTLKEKNIDYVLNTLFNFSIIGNQHKKQVDVIYFKYLQTNMNFNKNEKIVLHRGLLKSLQII